MHKYIPALAILFAASACSGGKTETAPATTSADDIAGEAAKNAVSGGTGIGVAAADLPDFVDLPEGARAITNMRVNDDGKAGGTLTLEARQSPADLVAFYRASMARHGLKIGLENTADQMVQLMGESEDKTKTLMVTVLTDGEGGTTLNLVHSRTTS